MTGKPTLTIVNTFSNQQTLNITSFCEALLCLCDTVCILRKGHRAYGQEAGCGQECDSTGVHTMAPTVNQVSKATLNEPSPTLSNPKWAKNPHALTHQAELWANHFLLLTPHREYTKVGYLILTSTLSTREPLNERWQGGYSGLAIKSPFCISSYLQKH